MDGSCKDVFDSVPLGSMPRNLQERKYRESRHGFFELGRWGWPSDGYSGSVSGDSDEDCG